MAAKTEPTVYQLAFDGDFGLERETLRVDERGFLSQTPHPFPGNPRIDRDFCESQIEIVSPVCRSISELYNAVESTDEETKAGLQERAPREYLWPFSNPPYILGEDSIPIAKFEGLLKHKEVYRRYLSQKYGKRKMLFCGIHFNYSYSERFLGRMMEREGRSDLQGFRNQMYLRLSEQIELTSWLPVFLTSASPVFDGSFLEGGKQGETMLSEEASMRSGRGGYWNEFVPIIDYTDIERYTASVETYVRNGQLYSPSEWYTPVRVKPRGENNLETLRKNGANHIELRMLDINPLSHIGVLKEDLRFLHLYLIYLTFQEREPFGEAEQIAAVEDHKNAALFDVDDVAVHLHGAEMPLARAALSFLEEMEEFFRFIRRDDVLPVLEIMKERCLVKEKRHAYRIRRLFGESFVERGMALARAYDAPKAEDLIKRFSGDGGDCSADQAKEESPFVNC